MRAILIFLYLSNCIPLAQAADSSNIAVSNVDIASRFATAIVAFVAAMIALAQFRQSRHENRIKRFFQLSVDFRSNPTFQKILNEIYSGSGSYSGISLADKIEFMSFFVDIAFLVHTRQLPMGLAFLMFGGDAIAASKVTDLMVVTRNAHWTLFHQFVADMKKMENTYTEGKDRISASHLDQLLR